MIHPKRSGMLAVTIYYKSHPVCVCVCVWKGGWVVVDMDALL